MKKYSIRRPGCVGWTDTDDLDDAKEEKIYANANIAPGHIIVNNETGEEE